jgi:hypothetical protein
MYYYLANQEEINEGHMGEYVGIYTNKVVAYYKDRLEGAIDMQKRGYKPGTYNVTKCHPVGEPEIYMGTVPISGDPL